MKKLTKNLLYQKEKNDIMNTPSAELELISHYPFLSIAKSFVTKKVSNLDLELLNLGKKRIINALSLDPNNFNAESVKQFYKCSEDYVFAYAASRFILSAWPNLYIKQRMAVIESKLARYFLERDSLDNLGMVCRELGINFVFDYNHYFLKVFDYLNYHPSDKNYKLFYVNLNNGFVKLSKNQFNRVLEEAIRKRLENFPKITNYPKEVDAIIKEMETKFIPKKDISALNIRAEDFPPCIKKLIDQLTSSHNVPHTGRVTLAIYLSRAGMSNEQIQKIFSYAPDFNPDITKYQIEFIRRKNYNMPSCKLMESYGLCIAECKCNSPLLFRKHLHLENAKRTITEEDEKYVK